LVSEVSFGSQAAFVTTEVDGSAPPEHLTQAETAGPGLLADVGELRIRGLLLDKRLRWRL